LPPGSCKNFIGILWETGVVGPKGLFDFSHNLVNWYHVRPWQVPFSANDMAAEFAVVDNPSSRITVSYEMTSH
jgi:hypothetical protein